MHVSRSLTLMFGAFFAVAALAQQPGSVDYNRRYLPAHGVGDTRGKTVEDRWGAVATGRKDALGWVVDLDTEEDAKAMAVKDCADSGGEECKAAFAFVNACAAVASGPTMNGWSSGHPDKRSMRALKAGAMKVCGEDGCRIVREGCALPVR